MISFTLSLGISEVGVNSEVDIEPSIHRADDAMYEAKRTGKNKTVIHKENIL